MTEPDTGIGGIRPMRKTLFANASLVAMVAVGFVTSAPADEPNIGAMKVISSDTNSRLVALAVGKSVVIDLPRDVADVLVGNPKTAFAVVRSKRRVFITGGDVGQTNVFFWDAQGRQIGALDIDVSKDPQLRPPLLENSGKNGIVVEVFRGTIF